MTKWSMQTLVNLFGAPGIVTLFRDSSLLAPLAALDAAAPARRTPTGQAVKPARAAAREQREATPSLV